MTASQSGEPQGARAFLFLQGPISPFFTRIGDALAQRGHAVHSVHLNIGDWMLWRRPGGISYRGRLAAWEAFIGGFMDHHRITDLVLLGEQRDYHKQAIALASERGIAVTVTDFGYLRPDWITFERDGMSACSRFPRDPDVIRRLAEGLPEADWSRRYQDSFWTMAFWDIGYHLANYFLWWLYPHYRSHKMANPILIYLGTGLRLLLGPWNQRRAERALRTLTAGGKPLFVFPLQMAYDFQLRAYSPFKDQDEAIDKVLTSFAAHAPGDSRLLVKVHPLDPGMRSWGGLVRSIARRLGIEQRVAYIDGGNLDRIITTAVGMVTINSTSGLRAIYLGCPVITLGDAIFDIGGLTFQQGLDRFWTECALPDRALRTAFVNLLAATIQLRGVYYNEPGLQAAVMAAAHRLHHRAVNEILPSDSPGR